MNRREKREEKTGSCFRIRHWYRNGRREQAIAAGVVCVLLFAGCGQNIPREETPQSVWPEETAAVKKEIAEGEENRAAIEESRTEEAETESAESGGETEIEEKVTERDFSSYFEGANGCAVFFYPEENRYEIYEPALAERRTTPCSTFKIISGTLGLEYGVIDTQDSVRKWSGQTFWNEAWNRDMDFEEAFRSSCIWYFRSVVDALGKERIQQELARLKYGNEDCSEWDGRAEREAVSRELTGFWVSSSLQISPKEQTQVLEQIFGTDSLYAASTRETMQQVMKTEESGPEVYAKTGMGKQNGVVSDAWYVGFWKPERTPAHKIEEKEDGNVYFAVYLTTSDGVEVSSGKAREIALELIQKEYE